MTAPRIPRGWKGLGKAVAWSLAFAVFTVALSLTLAWVMAAILSGGMEPGSTWLSVPGPTQIVVQGIAVLVGALVATQLIGIRILRLDWRTLRWRGTGPGARGFMIGAGLGIAAAAFTLLLAVVFGGARWVDDAGAGGAIAFATESLWTVLVLAPAAFSEEILFRGVPLVVLAMALGRGTAVVALAVVFGLAHGLNPGATGQGVANVALAGVFLGVAFYCPGGIWTAFGAHLGWNMALAVSGAAVSGVPFDIPVIDFEAGGPSWLTGGGFGPEGGLVATLSLGAATAAMLRWARKDPA